MANSANSARERMIERTINYDANEKSFADKLKDFVKKEETKWGTKIRRESGEELVEKFIKATDDGKKKMVADAEKAYTAKFEEAFGKTKGDELAKPIIKAIWQDKHPVSPTRYGRLEDGAPYGTPFGTTTGNDYDDIHEEYNEDLEDLAPNYWHTKGYLCELIRRTNKFGCDENVVICKETEKAIKAKFGKAASGKYKRVIGKLYDTMNRCKICCYDMGFLIQSLTSIEMYKQLEKKDKEWLDGYLDGILAGCEETEAEAKKERDEWEAWEKSHL